MGMRPCVAQLKGEWAYELMRRGRADQAAALLQQARSLAEELDMHEFLARLTAPGTGPSLGIRLTAEGDVCWWKAKANNAG